MQPNDPQQRPRAAGMICEQSATAGSADCGGWPGHGYLPDKRSLGNANLAASIHNVRIEFSKAACAAASD